MNKIQEGLKVNDQQIDYNQYKLSAKKKSKIGSKADIAKMAAPKAAQFLYNFLHIGPRLVLRSAYMLLRANIVTRILSSIVLVTFDTVSFIRKRISLRQYIINVGLALMLMLGGTAGWYGGSYVIGIFIENAVLGIIAGIIGAGLLGFVLGAIWEKIISIFVKDDTTAMLEICQEVFCRLAKEYSLNANQAQQAAETIKIDTNIVRQMYISQDKTTFACELIEPQLKEILENNET